MNEDIVFKNTFWNKNIILNRVVASIFLLHAIYMIVILYIVYVSYNFIEILYVTIGILGILLPTAIGIFIMSFTQPLRHAYSRHIWYTLLSVQSVIFLVITNSYITICYYFAELDMCAILKNTSSSIGNSSNNNSFYAVLGPFIILIIFRNDNIYQIIAIAISMIFYLWVIIIYSHTIVAWTSVALIIGAYLSAFAVKILQEGNDKFEYILEQELQNEINARQIAQENQQRAEIEKEHFTSYVFHEIRNPLNTIILSSNILDNLDTFKSKLTPEQEKDFQQIKNGLSSIENVINDTLDYRRTISGKIIVDANPFDILWTLDQSINEIVSVNSKPIILKKLIDDRIIQMKYQILGDINRLKQLFTNYLSNAYKYTEKGIVTLIARHDSHNEITNYLDLYFSVEDTGIGMTQESVEKMFKPFIQIRSDSGTGLGLSICANILNIMNGTYGVYSILDKGSLFWFKLRLPVSDILINNHVSTHNNGKQNLHILVTDDDLITRTLMKKILEKLGHISNTANNGKECIEMIQNDHYDLILLDNQMPIMNGEDVIKWLRNNNYNIPIIFLTGMSEPEKINELLNMGANSVLVKPVTMTLIDKTIKRVII